MLRTLATSWMACERRIVIGHEWSVSAADALGHYRGSFLQIERSRKLHQSARRHKQPDPRFRHQTATPRPSPLPLAGLRNPILWAFFMVSDQPVNIIAGVVFLRLDHYGPAREAHGARER